MIEQIATDFGIHLVTPDEVDEPGRGLRWRYTRHQSAELWELRRRNRLLEQEKQV